MNRRLCLFTLLVAAGSLSLSSCSRGEGPEEPVWGKQACAHCAMIVGDKRYAAQVVLGGERSHFDDVGCMIAFVEKRGSRPERAWVRDEAHDGWLESERARYRRGAKTPMDYGFAASTDGPLSFEDVSRDLVARSEERP